MKFKKKIPLVILFALIILIVCSINFHFLNTRVSTKGSDELNSSITDNEKNREDEQLGIEDSEDDSRTESLEEVSDSQIDDVSSEPEQVDESNTQQTPDNKNTTNTNNTVNINNNSSTNTSSNNTIPTITEWEKLGISEYDYYNSPEVSWKTVDFSVDEYGSKEETANACYSAGANYTGLESYRFRCDETSSYSGKFLGYHIEYIEL